MINFNELEKEYSYKTSRSGGAGGQHVNKVATKVFLLFHVADSTILDEEQKKILQTRLAHKINQEGFLQVSVQETRSQNTNKELAQQKIRVLIAEALQSRKKRKKTRIPKKEKEKRLKLKRIHSDKKSNRKDIKW